MKIFRLPLIVILFICTIIVGITTELITCAHSTVLNSDYYSQQMEKHSIYQIPQNYIMLKAKSEIETIQSEPISRSLQFAAEKTFSTEWTSNQVNYLITNFLDYLKNNRNEFNLVINLSDRKEKFKEELANSLDAYSSEDLMTVGIDSANNEEFAANILQNLALPESIDFSKSLYIDKISILHAFNSFRSYYAYTTFLPYIVMLFLLVAFMMIAGGAQGLKWFGNAVIFAGIILILIISGANSRIDEQIINNISRQDSLLASIGTNPLILATIMKNSIIGALNKIAIIFSLAGLTLIGIGAYWIKKVSNNHYSTHNRNF